MITAKQKRYLRGLAHDRKVIVQTGTAGLTDAVLAEIAVALDAHELVKIRLVAGDKDERSNMAKEVCLKLDAQLVQRIGHVITIYRRNDETPKIVLA